MNIVLDKLKDVVNLNAFVAFRPERAKLIYKTSKSAGLWQLELMDSEKKNLWTVGHYVDGLEDRSVEYDVFVKRSLRGYVDAVYSDDHCLRYVMRWQSGYIFIMLPNEYEERVVVAAPQVCGRANDPLQEPIYIWRNTSGRYYVLSCSNKLYEFETLDDLENWIKTKETMEDRDKKLVVFWREWYLIPGRLSGEEKWSDAVKKAKVGNYKPYPDEVVELIHRLT